MYNSHAIVIPLSAKSLEESLSLATLSLTFRYVKNASRWWEKRVNALWTFFIVIHITILITANKYKVLPPVWQFTLLQAELASMTMNCPCSMWTMIAFNKLIQQVHNWRVKKDMLNGHFCSTTPNMFWWSNQSHYKRRFTNPERVLNHQSGVWCLIVSVAFQPGCPRLYDMTQPNPLLIRPSTSIKSSWTASLTNTQYNTSLNNGQITEKPEPSMQDGIHSRRNTHLEAKGGPNRETHRDITACTHLKDRKAVLASYFQVPFLSSCIHIWSRKCKVFQRVFMFSIPRWPQVGWRQQSLRLTMRALPPQSRWNRALSRFPRLEHESGRSERG